MQAGVPQGSVLSPTLINLYINDAPQTHGVHLALFADDTCLYATDRKFAADTHLIKLQRLQNRVLRTIGNFSRRTPVRDLHVAFKIPHVYDYITKLCRQQTEVIQNHDNENVRNIGQGEARHRKYKRLKLGGGHAYDRSSD
jgi:hypothetical protein